MKHIERNYGTGTQMLPGSISGFYHPERYQPARQLLERIFQAKFVEIVDLRPLKDAANYPDLRGHMGWNPTNVLLNMHDPSLRDIEDRIVQALRELANGARAARGTPGNCLLLLGCNQGRHRSPMIRHLTTRWMEENHGMEVESTDIDRAHWSRHGNVHLPGSVYIVTSTMQMPPARRVWRGSSMKWTVQFSTSRGPPGQQRMRFLGSVSRDLGLEQLPPAPPLPPIPDGLFHRIRDNSALRDDWCTLWQHAIQTPTPPFRRLGENDNVIGEEA